MVNKRKPQAITNTRGRLLSRPRTTALLFKTLVKRLGGEAEITQSDIDGVADNKLEERVREDGSINFRLVERTKSS